MYWNRIYPQRYSRDMNRLPQIALVITFLLLSWLLMQVVHECGHVIGAVVSGGRIQQVILHPLVISRTDYSYNPHPLFVVWCGPILGMIIPVFIAGLSKKLAESLGYLFTAFAGFCLIANGIYLALGTIEGSGDVGEIIYYEGAVWPMIVLGLVCAPTGFYLWHVASPRFGFGKDPAEIQREHVLTCVTILMTVVALELALA